MPVSAENDVGRRQHVHSDRVRYMVFVLWLSGFSASQIGRKLGLRRGQLLGMVHRSEYRDRAAMTREQRQAALDELRAIRADANGENLLDRGVLGPDAFIARPLSKLSAAAGARSMAKAS